MFNRIELKNNAKEILSKNYWLIVVVTLIVGILGGSSDNGFKININTNGNDTTFSEGNIIEDFTNVYNEGIIDFKTDLNDFFSEIESVASDFIPGIIGIVLWIFTIGFSLKIVLSAFVINPLLVGCRKWYIQNRTTKPSLNDILYVFSNGYLNTVKIMFCKNLFTFLWSLLFFIPGIIKSYEYRMIPFLLAENPEMDMGEAFEKSRILMDGNKLDAFILDLSFIGWNLLSIFTCSILSLLYVNPYIELTNTELYICLCNRKGEHTQYYM